MSKTWIVAALAVALAVTACDSRVKSTSVTTPAPVSSATVAAPPAPTPIPVPLPAKPASFSDYATTIAAYLTANPAAAGGACLTDLIATWKMPLVTAADGCIAANTDEAFLGILGEDGVNVLKLNLALDALTATTP